MTNGFDNINQIEEIRKKNNTNWMDLLRLAYSLDPVTTKRIVAKIVENDKKISSVLEDFSK